MIRAASETTVSSICSINARLSEVSLLRAMGSSGGLRRVYSSAMGISQDALQDALVLASGKTGKTVHRCCSSYGCNDGRKCHNENYLMRKIKPSFGLKTEDNSEMNVSQDSVILSSEERRRCFVGQEPKFGHKGENEPAHLHSYDLTKRFRDKTCLNSNSKNSSSKQNIPYLRDLNCRNKYRNFGKHNTQWNVVRKITDTPLIGVQSTANANESHSTILNQDALKKKTPSISNISSNLFNRISPAQKISELSQTNETKWSDKWNSHDKQNSQWCVVRNHAANTAFTTNPRLKRNINGSISLSLNKEMIPAQKISGFSETNCSDKRIKHEQMNPQWCLVRDTSSDTIDTSQAHIKSDINRSISVAVRQEIAVLHTQPMIGRARSNIFQGVIDNFTFDLKLANIKANI